MNTPYYLVDLLELAYRESKSAIGDKKARMLESIFYLCDQLQEYISPRVPDSYRSYAISSCSDFKSWAEENFKSEGSYDAGVGMLEKHLFHIRMILGKTEEFCK